MTNSYDVDNEAVVEHLIDDPEVTDSHAVGRTLTAENNAPRRPRLVGQQVDRRSNSLLICTTQACDRLDGAACDLDIV